MTASITHKFQSTVAQDAGSGVAGGPVGPNEWNDTHIIAGEALSAVNDTNITLALAGTPTSALLNATSVTVGWSGTLAAARLNSNVVQAISNDTNVTGSISAQTLTLSWTGTLAVSRGGTGGGSASGTLLDNISGFASTGILSRTAAGTYAFRAVTGTVNRVAVTNGSGVSGNPTIDIDANYGGQSTITTLGTVTNGTWNATAVDAAHGGTGQTSYSIGDILYASGATALSRLADVAIGNALISGGLTTAPTWGKIGLTTHVTGTLPVVNGGTGVAAIPAFAAYQSAAQTVSTATFTRIAMDTKEFDTNSNYDNTTNYRFTPTVPGKYVITWQLVFSNITSGVAFVAALYRNGSAIKNALQVAGGTNTVGANGSAVVSMNGSTDYLEIYGYHETGADRNTGVNGTKYTYWSGVWVGA